MTAAPAASRPRPFSTRAARTAMVLVQVWFASWLVRTSAAAQEPPGLGHDPDRVRLVTTDLTHFSQLLDTLGHVRDTVAAVQRLYLDRATPGLRAYADHFGLDAASVAAALHDRPAFYASLKTLPGEVDALRPALRRALAGWKRILPEVLYPPVYFLVGTLRGGGLTREEGLLIGADMYSSRPGRPLGPPRSPGDVHSLSDLPDLVAHELAHYEQVAVQGPDRYLHLFEPGGRTLLGLAIREGSADFLAELASGGHINQVAHAYGLRHERALWSIFRKRMLGPETGDWLFVKPEHPGWPQDLGYFIGYRITQAFYCRSTDPREAVGEILAVTDFREFLDRSGYPPVPEGGTASCPSRSVTGRPQR